MKRILMAGGVVAWLTASVLLAKPGTVYVKGGTQHYYGEITEKDDEVVIEKNKIETVVKKSNVDHIDYEENVPDQFAARIKKLDPKDAKGRIELAHWAYDNHQYELARVALREALAIDPNSSEATELNDTIRRQMDLEKKNGAAGGDEGTTPEATTQPTSTDRLLKPSDINIIRQKELKTTDTNVRIRFDNDVEHRFANATNIDMGRFRNLKPLDKFMAIEHENDPAFLDDVKILTDPMAIVEFKRDVQRTVLNGCAASGCHGGPNAGRLMLIPSADNDAATYTNFYILQQYRLQPKKDKTTKDGGKGTDDGGIFGGASADRTMINRDRPDESLLLNYALPAEVSEYDHPQVSNYRGMFKNRSDARYRTIANWMKSLKPVEPDYGIQFTPPAGHPATTQPSSEPATQP